MAYLVFGYIMACITLAFMLFLGFSGAVGLFIPEVYEKVTKYFNPNYCFSVFRERYALTAAETTLVANLQHLYYLTLIPIAMILVVFLFRRFSQRSIFASHHWTRFFVVISCVFTVAFTVYAGFKVHDLNVIYKQYLGDPGMTHLYKYELAYYYVLSSPINNAIYIMIVYSATMYLQEEDRAEICAALAMIIVGTIIHPMVAYAAGKELNFLTLVINFIFGVAIIVFGVMSFGLAFNVKSDNLMMPLDEEIPYRSLIRKTKELEAKEHGWHDEFGIY